MEKEEAEYKFTPEDLAKLKKFRLIMLPFRVIIAGMFFALLVGGPRRLFSEVPGSVFILLFALQLLVERIFQAPDAGGERKDKRSAAWMWVGFGFAYFLGLIDFYWIRPWLQVNHPEWIVFEWNWWWIAAGATMYVAGQFIRVTAIRSLGRFFTISVRLHEEHQLIQEGLYSLIRHPAYTGFFFINLGFITLFASALAYSVFFFVGIPALAYRIRVEEKMLGDEFGEVYQAYSRKTKRLIPFLI